MRSSVPGSNLKGTAYIVFENLIFLHHSPGLLIQDRKQALFDIFSQLNGTYGYEGEKQKPEFKALEDAFMALQGGVENIDGVDYASPLKNEKRNSLDAIQIRIDRVIHDLGILKDAGRVDQYFEVE